MSRNIPPSPCPTCQTVLDSTIGITDKKAKPGPKYTLTVCATCGELLRFDNDMKHEKIPDDVLKEIKKKHPDTYTMLIRAQETLRIARKGLGQKPADN